MNRIIEFIRYFFRSLAKSFRRSHKMARDKILGKHKFLATDYENSLEEGKEFYNEKNLARHYEELAERIRKVLYEDLDLEEGKEFYQEENIRRHYEETGKRVKEGISGGGDELPEKFSVKYFKFVMLGREFLQRATAGNERAVKVFLDNGFPINFQDPQTKETALHAAAGSRARTVVSVLVDHGGCNYLLKDRRGRLASELAFQFAKDEKMEKILVEKELEQAKREGVPLDFFRPKY